MKFFLCSIFFTTPWLCLQIYIHYSWYEHNHCFMLRSWERYPVRTLKIYQNIQKQFENHVIYFKTNKSECFCRITEQWDCYFPSFIFIYLCDSSESLLNVLTTTRNSQVRKTHFPFRIFYSLEKIVFEIEMPCTVLVTELVIC